MKMAIVCLVALLAAGRAAPAADPLAAPAPPPLSIKIAIPERGAVVAVDERSHFHVVIENVSSQPQALFDEGNSWGCFNLRFEYTTSGGERRVMEKRPRVWKGNELTTVNLRPGEVLVRDIYLSDTVWSNLPVPARGEATVRIRAIFEQKAEGFDISGLWQGRIESPEAELTFRKGGLER